MDREAQKHEKSFPAPNGRWLRRLDCRGDVKHPVLAYGMDSCVLLIWSDGSHTTAGKESHFPSSNWEVWL